MTVGPACQQHFSTVENVARFKVVAADVSPRQLSGIMAPTHVGGYNSLQ
jgi:hypothetical protein